MAFIAVVFLLAACYPLEDDYCTLYEVDDYAWFSGGRNLYDSNLLYSDKSYKYTIVSQGASATGSLTVALSGVGTGGSVKVTLNGSEVSLPQMVLISALNVCRSGRPLRMVSVPWEMNVVVSPEVVS